MDPSVPSSAPEDFSSIDPAEQVSQLRDKCVVIVEDEGMTQILLKKICVMAGMRVVGTASDGLKGAEVVLQKKPDLVLMDIKMPLMNGLEATERIQTEYPVCIVLITAFSDEDYRERAQSLNVCGYITKPVSLDSLIPQLETAYRNFCENKTRKAET